MSKFHDLLSLRFRSKETPQKMTALVERSGNGELSSFSGVFRMNEVDELDKKSIDDLMKAFKPDDAPHAEEDAKQLLALTSEVKAISNQAVILHGERIKRGQEILKDYKEGAFTAWLIASYGNRQTPYNFLQYYDFYREMPSELHEKLDEVPRQAIYSLASRNVPQEKKEEIIRNYHGEPTSELLRLIRTEFPLSHEDERVPDHGRQAILLLRKGRELLQNPLAKLRVTQRKQLLDLLSKLSKAVEQAPSIEE